MAQDGLVGITNNDLSTVLLGNNLFKDELLTFAGAATVVEGTILARKAVADAIVAAADVGNTGDGTTTLAAVVTGPVVPLVGAYNLENVEAVVNGGVFKLEDPNGALIAERLTMTVGAGAATAFTVGGMTFTITDGATDFALGDKFSLTVAVDGKMVPYAIAGLGGAQIPKAVISYDVVAAGAGDEPCRPAISGEVRKEKLIIDLDGDGSNITDAILDQLRDFTVVAQNVGELNIADNA
jgi:hypothetical protein